MWLVINETSVGAEVELKAHSNKIRLIESAWGCGELVGVAGLCRAGQ